MAQGFGFRLLQMKYLTGFSASGSWSDSLIWGSFTINRDHFLFGGILSKLQTKRSRVRILEWDRDSLLRLPKGKVVLWFRTVTHSVFFKGHENLVVLVFNLSPHKYTSVPSRVCSGHLYFITASQTGIKPWNGGCCIIHTVGPWREFAKMDVGLTCLVCLLACTKDVQVIFASYVLVFSYKRNGF